MSDTSDTHYNPRTLGPREAEVVAWMETERPPTIDVDIVSQTFGWPRRSTQEIILRLQRKHWLTRSSRGHYEPLLGASGGWALPNPWAALASWGTPHYVAFASAAHEHGLTPDRPGAVQVCVPFGRTRPKGWSMLPVAFVHVRTFNDDGVEVRELHGFPIHISSVEKTLLDCALVIARAGGALGLARIADRALDRSNWEALVTLARAVPRGRAGTRRLAAILQLLGHEVPDALADYATATPGEALLYLDGPARGRRGKHLARWRVAVNIDADALREETRR